MTENSIPRDHQAIRPEAESLAIIEAAIKDEKNVELVYRKPDAEPIHVRMLSPYEVRPAHVGYRQKQVPPTIIGWDHDRRDFRTFRLDRVRGAAYVDVEAFVTQDEAKRRSAEAAA